MADITMCNGGDCPKKETCYRFTATPTPQWQAYFVKVPWDGKCGHYWEIESKSKKKQDGREK